MLTRGRRFLAQAAMVEGFGAEMPRVMRANPLVQVPGDVLLILRGYDAVHLASAEAVAGTETVFVGADVDLCTAARRLGLAVARLAS